MDEKRVEYEQFISDLGTAVKEISDSVLHELQTRYHMSFLIKGIEFDAGNSEIRYYMCPEDNPDVLFLAWAKADRSIHDDYIYRIQMLSISDQIRTKLDSESIISNIKVQALFDCFDESNLELDICSFLDKNKIHNLIIYLSIKGAGTDLSHAVRLATDCVKHLNTEILFDAYSFEDASYSACESYMRQSVNVTSRLILENNPEAHLSFIYSLNETNNGGNPDA